MGSQRAPRSLTRPCAAARLRVARRHAAREDSHPEVVRLRVRKPVAQLLTRPSSPAHRYTVYKDHITLEDYEIHDGMGLELYYQ